MSDKPELADCPKCGGLCERRQPFPFDFEYESLVKGEVVGQDEVRAFIGDDGGIDFLDWHIPSAGMKGHRAEVRVLVIQKEDSVIQERPGA